jgi:hypothetical protein
MVVNSLLISRRNSLLRTPKNHQSRHKCSSSY